MAMPLEHAGQVLGLFYFDASPQRGPFTELDLRFVASLSNLAAAKILAQRVAEELRRKQELEKELQAREAAAQAKGEFLALMSHEIRNPMNIVLGFTRLARKEALPPKLADYLKEIDHSGRSLMRLVNDILDYSKMEAGKLALEAIPFRPDAIVQQVLDQFAPAAAEKGLVLSQGHGGPGAEEPARAGAGPELLGDPLRLGQILTNLVGNAIKFTNEGTVQVDVHDGGNVAGRVQVRFSVRDTGIGIAPAQLARLFMPYTQAEASTSRQFGGTGLGLAISKRLVEMMGGILTAESQGPGSTFSFTLDLEAAPAPAAGLEAPASRTPCLTSRHLLLVEDNVPNQKLVRALLAETGARVSLAVTGSEALQRLADVAFDAVLIDLHLPDLDGVAITRRLRAEGRTLPVIAMTANTREERWDACLAAGMNDFVAKPIEPNLLFAALARCVPESAPDLPGPETGGPARAPLDQQVLDALTELMDVPRALDLVDGRAELLVGFLRDYLDHPLQPGAIAAAMARDDHEEAYRLSHDLKGIAGMLAMPAVAGACVEVLNHLGGRETGDWRSACGRIDEYMAPFLARARQALASADLIP
jgi:signal transduction histidine kinase/DNA-binding response OmpR family regulator